jgi:hypothetical protein
MRWVGWRWAKVEGTRRELDQFTDSSLSPVSTSSHHHHRGHSYPPYHPFKMSNIPHSLPILPLEVKGHILGFCDVPTLAVTSRVSLAFLELSGPLLYRDVVIRGCDQLDLLVRTHVSTYRPNSTQSKGLLAIFITLRLDGSTFGRAVPLPRSNQVAHLHATESRPRPHRRDRAPG